MASAPFEKNANGLAGKPQGVKTHARARGLTAWQKAVLTAGIISLGGVPAALMIVGSVPKSHPHSFSQNGAAIMSNSPPTQVGACSVPQRDDFKPTMKLQNREANE